MLFPRAAAIAMLSSIVALATPLARADAPAGWIIAGSSPKDYLFAADTENAVDGRRSASIAAKAGASAAGFGTLMQTIAADDYRGGRWRLSAHLRTENVARAQMWMRIDGPDRKVLGFDNMEMRPIVGTTNWTRYEIVLDVPSDSIDIAFGFVLGQAGKVWADGFKLEKVPLSVALTARGAARPRAPVNAGFED
jgi:hypothetical protein